MKLPLLEELDVSFSTLSRDSLRVVGQSCPNLKIFKLNCVGDIRTANEGEDDALAIAETMPGLHNLQLFGNKLTDAGLNAIIDHCLNLEHLDLRQCFNVNIVGDLEKRCSERVKVLRRPNDSTHDYPYEEVLVFNTMRASEDGFMPMLVIIMTSKVPVTILTTTRMMFMMTRMICTAICVSRCTGEMFSLSLLK